MTYNMTEIGFRFENLLSLGEAAEIWELEESTIRKAITSGRMINGEDCRKFGKQWVVTVEGMSKVFPAGKEKWTEHIYKSHIAKKRKS